MKTTKFRSRKRKDFSYITVVMFSVVFLLIFSIYTKAVDYNNSIISHKNNKTKSYYLAESSVVKSIDALNSMIDNYSSSSSTPTNPTFVYNDSERVRDPLSSVIYADKLKIHLGTSNVSVEKLSLLALSIYEYKHKIIRSAETKFLKYCGDAILYYAFSDQTNVINKVNSIDSNNVVIWVDSFYINQDFVLGSPTKSVTLIANNLSVNNNASIKIYGNLIVLGSVASNYMSNMNIYKVMNFDSGNYYCKYFSVFSSECNISIENTFFSGYLTFNRRATLNAGKLLLEYDLTTDIDNTEICVTGDIIAEDVKFNQSANITAGGDFIIGGSFTKNSSLQLTIGGKIAVEDSILFNGPKPVINTGGGRSALITEIRNGGDVPSNKFPITYQALNPMSYRESHSYKYTITKNGTRQYNIVAVGLYLKTETVINVEITADTYGTPTIVSIVEIKQ